MACLKLSTEEPWRKEMTEKLSKTSGSLPSLLHWELEKSFTFPTVAIIIAVALYVFMQASSGGHYSSSELQSLDALKGFWAASWMDTLSVSEVASFIYIVVISAALASNSLSGDMSRGYMRVLLSYPIGRMRFFLSKMLMLFLVPSIIFAGVVLFVAALVFPGLFWSIPPSSMTYALAVMLIQMYFIFAVSVSAALHIRQPVMSFLASVITLVSIQQVSDYLASPYKYFLPTNGTTVLMDCSLNPDWFAFQYGQIDLIAALIGMLILPTILLTVNCVYFKWWLQT
jgi:ABC-type transport system involved in multi-copper enzyme maturation permease subunit